MSIFKSELSEFFNFDSLSLQIDYQYQSEGRFLQHLLSPLSKNRTAR